MLLGEQGILGSLTLGGYDASRFVPNDVTFKLGGDDSTALNAQIQSISATNTLIGDTSLLSKNITATVNSDLPFMYLPNSTCEKFETAFGLSWDTSKELYLVNDTVHAELRKENPSVVFELGSSAAKSVNITLPYLSFDLQSTKPITENGTNYFPLRCSADESQYVLGRAFLQETYLLVDYEKANFSLSQAQFASGNTSNIVTIDHSAKALGNASIDGTGNAVTHSAGLGHGAIAGIAVGSSLALVLILAVLLFLLRRCRNGRPKNDGPIRGSISAPIPYDGTHKDSWPSSPTSNGGESHSNQPMRMTSHAESPFQRLEERLERLERETNARSPPSVDPWPHDRKLRNEISGDTMISPTSPSRADLPAYRPKQELQGTPAAMELQQARDSSQLQPKSGQKVFELD